MDVEMQSRPLRLIPQSAEAIASNFACPLCGTRHAAYVFGTPEFKISRCAGCALTFGEPRRGARAAAVEAPPPKQDEQSHAALIATLAAEPISGTVLLLADPGRGLAQILAERGIAACAFAVETNGETAIPEGRFAAAVISSDLMRVKDPLQALFEIRTRLPEGAPIFLSTPLLDMRQAKLMGKGWHEWRVANRWYFSTETLHLLLLRAGFGEVWFSPERRQYSLDEIGSRLAQGGQSTFRRNALGAVRGAAPSALRGKRFRLPAGTAIVSARTKPLDIEETLSIVVPVFNEAATFKTMMDALLAKELPGLRREIILVESNSTDGSRDLVKAYADHPEVRIILQSSPRGKGNAVREGLAASTGTIVMIQDADLEYDFDDYDGLLAPLRAWQTMFVLGTRHQGSWKVRRFNDAPLIATFLNFGHWFFQTLINVSLRTRMSDPFTMFKIFRRDAAYGLKFVSNRFDFDIELVMKLVRKGYIPLEISVNYASRSFSEGKKVSVTRDGLSWVWTIVKFRFGSIGTGRA